MDNEAVKRFIPWFLDARYPGKAHAVADGAPELGWVLDADGAVALVRGGSAKTPFVWFRGGVAHAVPRSEALAVYVASANKELMVGRGYLAQGDDLAMVVFDETILARDIDVERESCAEELVSRFEMSLQYTRDWSAAILARFGGVAFGPDDWTLLAF
jgi:hypothetical protein